jgi:uncharacterized protein (TIGR02600 family)
MKFPDPRHRRQQSMVLIMALVAIAVLTVLVLALFQGVALQTRGAQNSAILAQEDLLADSAAALVEGQIAQAASYTNQTTWMSQPGLVRTYSLTNPANPRVPLACYKLYSATNLAAMTDTSGSIAFMSADVPANWSSQPALYVDLNTPAKTATQETVYPIFDPAAINSVQGLSADSPNGAQMPVAWLYQLQDGTLGPAGNATAANPIVARIAFWTDDETSKININTAGVGDGWNTPRANSPGDLAAATNQPAQGEYSAYPGHPATTSLNVVFGSISAPSAAQAGQWLALTPRYAWGGSQFGTVSTTPNQIVPAKSGHLYASPDELLFACTNTTPRTANAITPSQLETARFVLTAHSVAPETTLLGEPRIAIWPVADSGANLTATDRAITTASTIGTRGYFFQRNSPLNSLDDFTTNSPASAAAAASNLQLFGDLVNRGTNNLPGCIATFAQKYPGAQWPQLMLEIADSIHALNAVAPSGAAFAPSFASNGTNYGYGFVEPLTTTYGSGASAITLRGLGRCPTLSSLTLVFYVSGFGYTTSTGSSTSIDYETTPDTPGGASWNATFGSTTNVWSKVNSELVRAFIVPCTFQPGCGYPEVSDACTLQIQGLNSLSVSYYSTNAAGTAIPHTGTLGFPAPMKSLPLGTPLKNYSDRAWGGNEGPLAWTTSADALAQNPSKNYLFATTNALAVQIPSGSPYNSNPWLHKSPFTCGGANFTVIISDLNGNPLQTNAVSFPSFSAPQPPTMDGEADHMDAMPPATSISGWTSSAACAVAPSWYMTLEHRLATSASSRPLMIQAGDVCASVEAVDARLVAGFASVPTNFFQPHQLNSYVSANSLGGSQAHNIRFADGTSACFAPGNVLLGDTRSSGMTRNIFTPYAVTTATIPVHDWRTGALLASNTTTTPVTPYTYFTSAPCSVPAGTQGVYMTNTVANPQNGPGDWDTGPGYAPDGALINLPDAGTTNAAAAAYQSLSGNDVGAPTQRTPNALVPSPVIFGSLPAGINPAAPASSTPWRTLLFCPYPAANTSATPYAMHPGAASPPDYLLLDDFWMPVIEPYPISTCMATRGKINLNDQIAPFTYIHRSTALRGLLDSLRIPAISSQSALAYKTSGAGTANSIWNPVDENGTVAQIENRFAGSSADAYLSESEICSVPLVPRLSTPLDTSSVANAQAALVSFWNTAFANGANANGALTGDNLRELPYAQLYGRLTTRSNAYTVHIWAQVLKKLPNDPQQNVWREGIDVVLGEWRGEYEIERYLDPAASAPTAGSPLGPYDFRIVSRHRFAP